MQPEGWTTKTGGVLGATHFSGLAAQVRPPAGSAMPHWVADIRFDRNNMRLREHGNCFYFRGMQCYLGRTLKRERVGRLARPPSYGSEPRQVGCEA